MDSITPTVSDYLKMADQRVAELERENAELRQLLRERLGACECPLGIFRTIKLEGKTPDDIAYERASVVHNMHRELLDNVPIVLYECEYANKLVINAYVLVLRPADENSKFYNVFHRTQLGQEAIAYFYKRVPDTLEGALEDL